MGDNVARRKKIRLPFGFHIEEIPDPAIWARRQDYKSVACDECGVEKRPHLITRIPGDDRHAELMLCPTCYERWLEALGSDGKHICADCGEKMVWDESRTSVVWHPEQDKAVRVCPKCYEEIVAYWAKRLSCSASRTAQRGSLATA